MYLLSQVSQSQLATVITFEIHYIFSRYCRVNVYCNKTKEQKEHNQFTFSHLVRTKNHLNKTFL